MAPERGEIPTTNAGVTEMPAMVTKKIRRRVAPAPVTHVVFAREPAEAEVVSPRQGNAAVEDAPLLRSALAKLDSKLAETRGRDSAYRELDALLTSLGIPAAQNAAAGST